MSLTLMGIIFSTLVIVFSIWLAFLNKRLIKILISLLIIIFAILSAWFLILDGKHSKVKIDELELINKYTYISQFNCAGMTISPTNKSFVETMPISKALEGTWYINDSGSLQFKTGEEERIILLEAIEEFPEFPCSYFAVGLSLKYNNQPGAEEYLRKAKEITEIIVKIKGHNEAYDQLLEMVNDILKL